VVTIMSTHALDMGSAQRRPLPGFADRLAIMPDFLPPHTFAALRAEARHRGPKCFTVLAGGRTG